MKLETALRKIDFEPIKLTITLESADELCELYSRFNISYPQITSLIKEHTKGKHSEQFNTVFKLLSAEMERLNLLK